MIGRRDNQRFAEVPFPLGRLLCQNMLFKGLGAKNLARSRDLEAFFRRTVGLLLRPVANPPVRSWLLVFQAFLGARYMVMFLPSMRGGRSMTATSEQASLKRFMTS